MITEEQVLRALCEIRHPELKRDLVELGMVKGVAVEDGQVTVTLALPFMNIPVKDDLVHAVKEAVSGIDSAAQIEVGLVEMNQNERAAFMGKAEGGPGPAASANDISHVVAVLSGKGGVGKSSVAALLAVALRRREMRVGVLDADITGPSQPKIFGLDRQPTTSPLGILPVETGTGIKVMSINLLLQSEDQAVIWRGPLISNVIKQFWTGRAGLPGCRPAARHLGRLADGDAVHSPQRGGAGHLAAGPGGDGGAQGCPDDAAPGSPYHRVGGDHELCHLS
jgi:ATP-binding protein involved in chromosome partitioning